MRIYLKNDQAKFHPDPIWYDGALGLFELWRGRPQLEDEQDEQWYGISSWSKNSQQTIN